MVTEFKDLLNRAKDVYTQVFKSNYEPGSCQEEWSNTLKKSFARLEALCQFLENYPTVINQVWEQGMRWINFFREVFVSTMDSFCSWIFLDFVSEAAHKSKMEMFQRDIQHIDSLHDRLLNDILPKLIGLIARADEQLKSFIRVSSKSLQWNIEVILARTF